MVCGLEGEAYGKCTLLIPPTVDKSLCFEVRRLSKKEQAIYDREVECRDGERMETREYYDMTGHGDCVYKIGFIK